MHFTAWKHCKLRIQGLLMSVSALFSLLWFNKSQKMLGSRRGASGVEALVKDHVFVMFKRAVMTFNSREGTTEYRHGSRRHIKTYNKEEHIYKVYMQGEMRQSTTLARGGEW